MFIGDDNYFTHLPVLEALCDKYKVQTAFEFGMGPGSTKWFSEHCKETVSVEMNSVEWYSYVTAINLKNVSFVLMEGPIAATQYLDKLGQFDIILCDGHSLSRTRQAQVAMKHSKIVVMHDTNDYNYGWWNLKIPDDYQLHHWEGTMPCRTSTLIHTDLL